MLLGTGDTVVDRTVSALKEFTFQRMIQAVNKQMIYNILPDNDKGYEADT